MKTDKYKKKTAGDPKRTRTKWTASCTGRFIWKKLITGAQKFIALEIKSKTQLKKNVLRACTIAN